MLAALVMMLSTAPNAQKTNLHEEVVKYASDGTTMNGFLVYDAARNGKRPGVIVVHEWWGANDYVRRRARMLAELGYTALAIDMYGNGEVATNPTDATRLSQAATKDEALERARFVAGLKVLRSQPTVDAKRVGAIGYCFGGGVVLQMARDGLDLSGVVSFHGSLATTKPATEGRVRPKVLVYTGGDDSLVPPTTVAAFKDEMTKAGANVEIITVPGAKHAFTNPDADGYARKFSLPIGYQAAGDKVAWEGMKKFFAQVFGA